MANLKTITKEFTKELLPDAQKLIDEKIKGPKLKKKKEPLTEGDSIRNKELSVEKSLKEKNLKEPKPVTQLIKLKRCSLQKRVK